MRNATRAELGKLQDDVDKAQSAMDTIKDRIESLEQDEREKFDNLTEGLQMAERGQAIEAAADALASARDALEQAVEALAEASGYISEAQA